MNFIINRLLENIEIDCIKTPVSDEQGGSVAGVF